MEIDNKMKMRPNEWMENEKFLSKIDYSNIYYIKSLGKVFYAYLKTIPVPVLTTWDPVHKRIYVHIGNEKRFFEVDENIHYFDFTYLVDQWVSKFFPKFEIEEEVECEFSDDEIYEKVKEGMRLDDAILLKKIGTKKDCGIITKIVITNDEFVFNRNGSEYIRIAGTLDNLMPLSVFLKKFRDIDNDIERRKFILENSRELKNLNEQKKQILIDYPFKMMKNFFTIRYNNLKNNSITKITDKIYEWNKFKIVFDSEDVERDCLHYLYQKRLEDGIEII